MRAVVDNVFYKNEANFGQLSKNTCMKIDFFSFNNKLHMQNNGYFILCP